MPNKKKAMTASEAAKWFSSKQGKKELQKAIDDGEELGQRMIANSEAKPSLLLVPYTL